MQPVNIVKQGLRLYTTGSVSSLRAAMSSVYLSLLELREELIDSYSPFNYGYLEYSRPQDVNIRNYPEYYSKELLNKEHLLPWEVKALIDEAEGNPNV